MATLGAGVTEKKNTKVYNTPGWATQEIIRVEKFEGDIWEPAAGEGALVNELRRTLKNRVIASDFKQYHFKLDFIADYFAKCREYAAAGEMVDNIITNPPFGFTDDWIKEGLPVVRDKFILLLPLRYLEGQDRYKYIFSKTPPTRIYQFVRRVTMYPFGVQTGGSSTMAVAWFVWEKRLIAPGRPPEVYWVGQ